MSAAVAMKNGQAVDMKALFEPRIKELNALAEEIAQKSRIEKKDDFGYLVPGISKLTTMMLDCEQYNVDIDPEGEAVLVDRVVKVNRYADRISLEMHGVDHVVCTALFVAVPMYLLPASKVDKATKNRFRNVIHPEEFGLPGTDVVDYGTIKQLSATAYTAMAKFPGSYANELITTARNYDHVYLK